MHGSLNTMHMPDRDIPCMLLIHMYACALTLHQGMIRRTWQPATL